MKLPNSRASVISQEKICAYLLDSAHPGNGGKAAFFELLGFSLANWTKLAAALKEIAENGEVTARVESPYGRKYTVDGILIAPAGEDAPVRTIWIIEHGQDAPRLVTAYPLKK